MKIIKTYCLSIMTFIAITAISLQQVPAQDAGKSTTSLAPKSTPATMPANGKTITTTQSAASQPTNADRLSSPEKLFEALMQTRMAETSSKTPSDPHTRPDWDSLTTLQKDTLLATYKKQCEDFSAGKAAIVAAAEQEFIGKTVQWILILDDVQAGNPDYTLSLRSDSDFRITFTVPETNKQNALALHKGDYVAVNGIIEKSTLANDSPWAKDAFSTTTPTFNISLTNTSFSVSTREAFLKTVSAMSEVRFFGNKTKADAVIYVIDHSGSMLEIFDVLKLEMLRSIASLRDSQEFQIIFYSSGKPLEMEPSDLKLATKENKLKAIDFIKGITPEGNTNPAPAMEGALKLLGTSKKTNKIIYLLTDGLFDDPPLVINTIKQKNVGNSKSLINTFFYGENKPLENVEKILQNIANDNGGRYMYVEPTLSGNEIAKQTEAVISSIKNLPPDAPKSDAPKSDAPKSDDKKLTVDEQCDSWLTLAETAQKNGQYEAARSYYRKIITLEPVAQTLQPTVG